MAPQVAVLTDSAACLPGPRAAAARIRVIPLSVSIGGQPAEDAPDSAHRVAAALRAGTAVTTSMPAPATISAAFAAAVADGAVAIVSVHLSGALSGTVAAARAAGLAAGVPVLVVDSATAGMAQGYAVLAAAEAAAAGRPAGEVAAAAAAAAARTRLLFVVETVDPLRAGGRLAPSGRLGGPGRRGPLASRPVLELSGGRLSVRDTCRTAGRALARLEQLAVGYAIGSPDGEIPRAGAVEADPGEGPPGPDHPMVDLAVHHVDALTRAEELGSRLRDAVPYLGELVVTPASAALAAHAGPGTLAVVVHRRPGPDADAILMR